MEGQKKVRAVNEDAQNGNDVNPNKPTSHVAETNNNLQELQLAFKALDVDGDGVLSKEEMKSGFKMLGFNLSSKMMDVMFEQADVDGDGVINFSEFCRVVS